MSVRSVRLCDYENGTCSSPTLMACPICERDCCRGHMGKGWIGVATVILRDRIHRTLDIQRVAVCCDCIRELSNPDRVLPPEDAAQASAQPFDSLTEEAFKELPSFTKAWIAAEKLKRSAK